MANKTLYAVRDMRNGQLVSDITSTKRMFWRFFAGAENAILEYNKRKAKPKHGELEIVEFELEEVASYTAGWGK